jgi:hypothetical protein
VPHHLEPVRPGSPDPFGPDDLDLFDPGVDELAPLARPAWWRWVALAVIVAMIVAGPFAYALSKLLS